MSNKRIIKLGFSGSLGQMNSTIINLALKDKNFVISSLYEPYKNVTENDFIASDNIKIFHSNDISVLENSDIILDFSHDSNTYNIIKSLAEKNKKFVIGTTKLSENTFNLINYASKQTAIFYSPNMSYGINAFFSLIPILMEKFYNFDIEIVETHHRKKKDAPSGTALKILEIMKKKRENLNPVFDRSKSDKPREDNDIGISSIRGGGVYGNHSVLFLAESEEIEFTHRMINKDSLAKGALIAAKYIANKSKGLYFYEDLLREIK